MAQLIFPPNPTNNQEYAGDNGITYVYKSPPGVWTASGGGGSENIYQPHITVPTPGATGVGPYTSLASSSFEYVTTALNHQSSTWQVENTQSGQLIVNETSTTHLVSFPLYSGYGSQVTTVLTQNTGYRARVRYNSSGESSAWSPWSYFATATIFPGPSNLPTGWELLANMSAVDVFFSEKEGVMYALAEGGAAPYTQAGVYFSQNEGADWVYSNSVYGSSAPTISCMQDVSMGCLVNKLWNIAASSEGRAACIAGLSVIPQSIAVWPQWNGTIFPGTQSNAVGSFMQAYNPTTNETVFSSGQQLRLLSNTYPYDTQSVISTATDDYCWWAITYVPETDVSMWCFSKRGDGRTGVTYKNGWIGDGLAGGVDLNYTIDPISSGGMSMLGQLGEYFYVNTSTGAAYRRLADSNWSAFTGSRITPTPYGFFSAAAANQVYFYPLTTMTRQSVFSSATGTVRSIRYTGGELYLCTTTGLYRATYS